MKPALPPLRFGLIGAGRQGCLLATALVRVPDARLVACCDPDASAREAVPGASLVRCADVGALLDLPDLDAVIVATPHPFLADAALAAVESGRHVFCEKPFATAASEARPVVAAADRVGVRLMVGYLLRFNPLRRELKCLLDDGAIGEPTCVVAGKGGPPLVGWTAQRVSGGGQLLWVGSHLIDQVLWLVGRPVDRVFAEIHRSSDGVTDLTSVVTLRFDGGLLAHLDCSQAADAPYDFVELAGTAGRARVDWRPHPQLMLRSNRRPGYTTRPRPHSLLQESVAELTEFVGAIRDSRQPAITGYDGLRVLEVLDAVVLSAERAAPVSLAAAA